jgi:hypothetical protein
MCAVHFVQFLGSYFYLRISAKGDGLNYSRLRSDKCQRASMSRPDQVLSERGHVFHRRENTHFERVIHCLEAWLLLRSLDV